MKLKFPLLIMILFWLISGVQLQAQDLTSTVTALDWNSSGDLIAVALGKPANEFCYNNPDYYVINLLNSDGSLSKELRRHACAITGVAFSPDDSQLISVDLSGLIVLWDVSSGEQLVNTEARFPWKKVAWSAHTSTILIIEDYAAFLNDPPYDSGHQSLVVGHKTGITDSLTDAAWSPDETSVAVSSIDNSVVIWDVNTTHRSQIIYKFHGHTVAVKSVDWSPRSDLIASGDVNGVIKIWNAVTGQELISTSAHTGAVNDLRWSHDGRALASTGDDGKVNIWNIQTSSSSLQPELHPLIPSLNYQAPVYALDWSPDGTKIVYGGQGIDGQNGRTEIFDLGLVLVPVYPIAHAGLDQTVGSIDGGAGLVTLDASSSGDSDGTITNYVWREGSTILADVENPLTEVFLEVGTHTLTLTATDNDGLTDTDDVVITVMDTPTKTPTNTYPATPTKTLTNTRVPPTATNVPTNTPSPSMATPVPPSAPSAGG